MLSYSAWQMRFGGARGIAGRTVLLAGFPFAIIGVTDSDFGGLDPEIPDFWAPFSAESKLYAGSRTIFEGRVHRDLALQIIGRVVPGLALQQALTVLNAIGPRLPVGRSRSSPSSSTRGITCIRR